MSSNSVHERHDIYITEILLKVALNTIKQTKSSLELVFDCFYCTNFKYNFWTLNLCHLWVTPTCIYNRDDHIILDNYLFLCIISMIISYQSDKVKRIFYINSNWDGCDNDKGWIMVNDVNSQPPCPWETMYVTQAPFIIYSPLSSRTTYELGKFL